MKEVLPEDCCALRGCMIIMTYMYVVSVVDSLCLYIGVHPISGDISILRIEDTKTSLGKDIPGRSLRCVQYQIVLGGISKVHAFLSNVSHFVCGRGFDLI